MINDQAQRLRDVVSKNKEIRPDNQPKIVCISSGKGGVGKSNFTTNTALELIKRGKKVIIIDADLGLANVEILLGVVSKRNFSDLINSGANIKDIITVTNNGIGLISGGSGILELADLSNDKLEIVLESISQLNDMADYILIDTGAGISNVVTAFAKLAHEVVVITTCEPTSVADAYALIKSLVIKDREKDISVVVNRAENIKEAQGVFDNINTVSSNFIKKDLNFLGFIYDDVSVSRAVKRQRAFIEMSPSANASKCIVSICDKLIDKKSDTQNFKKLVDRFKNLFR